MSDIALTPPMAVLIPPRPLTGAARLGIAVWVALAILLLFAGAMTRVVTYDEDQYVAAGVMARHLLPYRDFAYLQSPLYPFVLAPLFAVTDGWFLLTGRLLTFVLSVGSGALLWRVVRRLGAGVAVSMVLLTACLASPFLTTPLANTRNDILPLFLMLAGWAVHLWAVERSWAGRVVAALLFGLAVEAKVSFVFGPVMLGLHALSAPRPRLAPYVLGSALAAVPALLCWLAAPEAFRFGVLDYHLTAPGTWYAAQGLGEMLTPWDRLEALADWATLGGNLTLLVLSVALSLLATARHRKWKRPGLLLVGMTLSALLLAFVPSPSWPMYYAALPPLLACCIAHLDRTTIFLAGAARKRVLFGVAALPIIPYLLEQSLDVVHLFDPAQWVGVAAHRNALEIRAALPAGAGDVATLFPHAVLDANPVRAEFASGPFVFRSGGQYSAALLQRLHALSPETVAAAFDRAPPAAIYAGLYAPSWTIPMDAALTAYAERHGWHVARTDAAGGQLWVPP